MKRAILRIYCFVKTCAEKDVRAHVLDERMINHYSCLLFEL